MAEFDRLPPYDLAAEESVLGACLVDDTAYARIASIVTPADFYQSQHGAIFAAMARLAARNEPCSPVLVAHELGTLLADLGGMARLSQLTSDLPTAVGCEHYARIVARCSFYRRLLSAAGRIAQMAYDGGDDDQAVLAASYEAIHQAAGTLGASTWQDAASVLAQEWDAIIAELTDPEASRGVSTGWPSVDRLLYGAGLLPGNLYTWVAQTSIGKSTVGRTLLRNIALAGTGCALFTLEQGTRIVVRQILYGMAALDVHAHQTARPKPTPITEQEERRLMAANARFLDHLHRLHIDQTSGITPAQVRLRVAELKAEHDVRVVAIDYLHRMHGDRQRNNDSKELEDIAYALADMARDLDVAIVLFAQLNRDNLDSSRAKDEFRPTIGDLHGSSGVEKASFGIVGIHRRQWYVDRRRLPPQPGTEHDLELIMLKQQLGPGNGTALLRFHGPLAAVDDPEWGME